MAKPIRQRTLNVDGREVVVLEKRIRRMSLRVQPPDCHVEVSVPTRTPNSLIKSFVQSQQNWIEKTTQRLKASPIYQAENATPEEIKQWREVVEACTPPLVSAWEPILGVKAGKLAYRNMKSRWGSCQPATGRICINIRLALYPPECLEYVVVHELVHLLVHGHGQEFQAIMDRVMPDWKKRRAKLR